MNSQQLYHRGLFSELKNQDKSDIYKIAALIFLGQHQEARWLANQDEADHDINQRVFVQFHLGISYTRTSHYKKAAEFFKKNMQLLKTEKLSHESEFLCYQGLGFFHFFFSRHRKSLQSAYQAHKKLLLLDKNSNKALYEVLCLDLEGHNLINRLRIHKGIETLEKALSVAQKNKMSSFVKSLTFSILIYKCKYIYKPEEGLTTLLKLMKEISPDDGYSVSVLIFEISNLMMLKGKIKEAQNFLSENIKIVYQNDNKRLMGQLNFRMTYCLYRQGSYEQALYLAKTARANLKELTDRGLIAQISGLEIKILETMGEDTKSLKKELKNLDQSIDSLLIKRKNARTLSAKQTTNSGEDKLGDLIEEMQIKKTKSNYKKLVSDQLYGLLNEYFEINPGDECIILNAPQQHCVVIKNDKIHLVNKALGSLINKILITLSHGDVSKEELVKKIWNYSEYDPSRHDSLIYSSMTRLRQLLDLSEQQLFFDGETYRLRLKVVNYQPITPKESKTELAKKTLVLEAKYQEMDDRLNYRQVAIIETEQFDPISVKDYADQFDVTTMTALRDLKKLCELSYLKKFGQGRATRYLKNFHG